MKGILMTDKGIDHVVELVGDTQMVNPLIKPPIDRYEAFHKGRKVKFHVLDSRSPFCGSFVTFLCVRNFGLFRIEQRVCLEDGARHGRQIETSYSEYGHIRTENLSDFEKDEKVYDRVKIFDDTKNTLLFYEECYEHRCLAKDPFRLSGLKITFDAEKNTQSAYFLNQDGELNKKKTAQLQEALKETSSVYNQKKSLNAEDQANKYADRVFDAARQIPLPQ